MRNGWMKARGVLTFMLNAFFFFWVYFAGMTYIITLAISPVISFFYFGVFRLPEWVTPMKLLTTPIAVAFIVTILLGAAYLLGFKFEKDKIVFPRGKSDKNLSE